MSFRYEGWCGDARYQHDFTQFFLFDRMSNGFNESHKSCLLEFFLRAWREIECYVLYFSIIKYHHGQCHALCDVLLHHLYLRMKESENFLNTLLSFYDFLFNWPYTLLRVWIFALFDFHVVSSEWVLIVWKRSTIRVWSRSRLTSYTIIASLISKPQ